MLESLRQKELLNKLIIPLSLTYFINPNDFFDKIDLFTNAYFKGAINKDKSYYNINFQIKKWNDLYDLLQIINESNIQSSFRIYLLIDQITDIHSFMSFTKPLSKLFALTNSFNILKLILVSNFDIVNSEARTMFDLSSFISLCMPQKSKEEFIIVVRNSLEDCKVEKKNEIINRSVANYEYAIVNLNEIIHCTKENIEAVKSFQNDKNIHKISSNKALDNSILQQIQYTPLHIRKLENNQQITDSKAMETTILQSGKNLTESLSVSQKVLLLSSFLANETNPNSDMAIFKNLKRTRLHHYKERKGLNLKSKASHPFYFTRLIGIYQSMRSIIDNKDSSNENINIELISDIGTLTNLNLIRAVKSNESNIMGRKYISCVGIDFALKIAEDFGIKLDDFVRCENN